MIKYVSVKISNSGGIIMKQTIVMLYGGRSAERDVSILSAFSILNAINYDKYSVKTYFITQSGDFIKGAIFDQLPKDKSALLNNETADLQNKISPSDIYEAGAICFPVLHGPMGEDGTIQGFLETIKMAYVGVGVLASATGMDKITTKLLLETAGIPQVAFIAVNRFECKNDIQSVVKKIEQKLNYPMFIKPANLGSSVGISKAETSTELIDALKLAANYDSRIVVEQGIDAREIEVAVLGNEIVETTQPGEIVKEVAFYDYNAKYIDNQITMQIPANVSADAMDKVRNFAKAAYQLLDCSGLSRCDFFLDEGNNLYLNELNTMPGFTEFSMYPLLWENMGLKYADLIEKLLALAVERFEVRQGYYEGN